MAFTVGDEKLLQISESSQDSVIVGDGGDVDFQVKSLGDDNTIFVLGSADNVGIGTATPGEKLTVEGNISGSSTSTGSFGSAQLHNLPTHDPLTTGSLWVSGSSVNADGIPAGFVMVSGIHT